MLMFVLASHEKAQRKSSRVKGSLFNILYSLPMYYSSMLNTERKSTGFESNSQSCDISCNFAHANVHGSSEVVHLPNEKHVFHFQICMFDQARLEFCG